MELLIIIILALNLFITYISYLLFRFDIIDNYGGKCNNEDYLMFLFLLPIFNLFPLIYGLTDNDSMFYRLRKYKKVYYKKVEYNHFLEKFFNTKTYYFKYKN